MASEETSTGRNRPALSGAAILASKHIVEAGRTDTCQEVTEAGFVSERVAVSLEAAFQTENKDRLDA